MKIKITLPREWVDEILLKNINIANVKKEDILLEIKGEAKEYSDLEDLSFSPYKRGDQGTQYYYALEYGGDFVVCKKFEDYDAQDTRNYDSGNYFDTFKGATIECARKKEEKERHDELSKHSDPFPEDKFWRAEVGEKYWSRNVYNNGVVSFIETRHPLDDKKHANRNYYKTSNDAEKSLLKNNE